MLICYFLVTLLFSVGRGHPLPHHKNLHMLMSEEEFRFIFGVQRLQGDPDYELWEAKLMPDQSVQFTTSSDAFSVVMRSRRNLVSPSLNATLGGVIDEACLLEGVVPSLDAVAAFSTCDGQGLRGVMATDDVVYEFHPVPKRLRGRREIPSSIGDRLIVHRERQSPESHRFLRRGRRAVAKRDARPTKTIEVSIFVDDQLRQWVARQSPESDKQRAVTDLVLAIMNAVQAVFDHASLATRFKFVIVHLEVIEPSVFVTDGRIDDYLNSFCVWQSQHKTGKPHWDHAILLTGIDLYANDSSDKKAVGMAWVSGMCRETLSCTLNEGTAFSSIYVISHEIGHNLGMQHDGKDNKCNSTRHIMSPSVASGRTTWSECSNDYVQQFLAEPEAECLNNDATPVDQWDFSKGALPGQRFPAELQCSIAYGENFHPYVEDQPPYNNMCDTLWCANETHAKNTFRALDGTACDSNKICLHGECVLEPTTQLEVTTTSTSSTSTTATTSTPTTRTASPTTESVVKAIIEVMDDRRIVKLQKGFGEDMEFGAVQEERRHVVLFDEHGSSWLERRTPCSSTCQQGTWLVFYVCTDSAGTPSTLCPESLRPDDRLEQCNAGPCVA